MKDISSLVSGEYKLTISEEAKYFGNEAELIPITIYGVKNKVDNYLYRNHIIGNHKSLNKEIENIYDEILDINSKYKSEEIDYRLKIVKHLKDSNGNIYIKDLNSGEKSFSVYDLMPDGYYINPDKKDNSKFNDFKHAVKELKLNKLTIIPNIFEQLAILHANNFVMGEIDDGERGIKHPTLSLFLYKLRDKKGNINEEILIHDIHNLKKLDNPGLFDYIKHCVGDIKNLSFDIIRFFKGIGLPHGGFKIYGETLKKLNYDLYKIMYNGFLWDPKLEIEVSAMENIESNEKKVVKTSKAVLGEVHNPDIKLALNNFFIKSDLFFLKKSKNKFIEFVKNMNADNTEFIFDFDNTLTYPGSKNSLNSYYENDEGSEGFLFRIGVILLLRILITKGFNVKIYSLGIKEIILSTLNDNGVDIGVDNIFSNTKENIVNDKKNILVDIDNKKKRIIFGDSLDDFDIEGINDEDLKIGFLNNKSTKNSSKKTLSFNKNLDLYFIGTNSNFLGFLNIVKSLK